MESNITEPVEPIVEPSSIEIVVEGEVMDDRGERPESVRQPWHRLDKESVIWYERFVRYYLQLGIGRSLYKAYRLYILTEGEPVKQAKMLRNVTSKVEGMWRHKSAEYQWHKRAEAWDNFEASIDQDVVNKAKRTILGSMDKAAEALVKSLDNPRLSVMAAKEILDRGGMGAIQKVGVVAIPYTSDELNRASEELKEWKKKSLQGQQSEPSG